VIYTIKAYPSVVGIFTGGCVERGEGSRFRARAHAHNHKDDPDYGWICVLSFKRIGTTVEYDDGTGTITKPSRLMLHEIAHILTPNHGHDAAWREMVSRIGAPSEATSYLKRFGSTRRIPGTNT